MDENERERFLATLRTDDDFRAAVRRELLTEELLNLPRLVADLAATVSTLVDTVAGQRRDIDGLAGTVQSLKQGVADALGHSITSLASFQTAMTAGFTAMTAGFTAVTADLTDLRSDVTGLRSEVSSLRTDMDSGFAAVQAKFDQVDADLANIKDQLAS